MRNLKISPYCSRFILFSENPEKNFFPYLPYTNDIQTIQEDRRIVKQLPKIKYLMLLPKLEKYSVLPTHLSRHTCVFCAIRARLKLPTCSLTFFKISIQTVRVMC